MEDIDTKIVGLFNKYYTLLKRDNPNNQSDAIQTAAVLTQAHVFKDSIINTMSTISGSVYISDYGYKFDDLNNNLRNINSTFEQAKADVVHACNELQRTIQHLY